MRGDGLTARCRYGQAGRLVAVDHPNGAEFSDEDYSYDEADRRRV